MNQMSNSMPVGPVPQMSPNRGLILSYPTFFPGLDSNYLRANIILTVGGAVIFLAFVFARIYRHFALRKQVPSGVDNEGKLVIYMSISRKYLGWPGVILEKARLKSFKFAGVPSVGMMLILVFWFGVTIVATSLFILPALDLEGIAYRLP